jgi:hypothetical protein
MLDTTVLDLNPFHSESLHIPMSYEEYVAFEHTRSLVEWVNGAAMTQLLATPGMVVAAAAAGCPPRAAGDGAADTAR